MEFLAKSIIFKINHDFGLFADKFSYARVFSQLTAYESAYTAMQPFLNSYASLGNLFHPQVCPYSCPTGKQYQTMYQI
jgi:hypothetical protein